MEFRKPPTELEVHAWLQTGRLSLSPLRFRLRKTKPRYPGGIRTWDFELEGNWHDQKATFAVEYKQLSTPKAFDEALQQCKAAVLPAGRYALILLPYLRESQLEELERQGVSGVDWCGNGVVMVEDRFRVFRSGRPNQFATYAPIKNIYRKNTSMVARVLLTAARFASVQEVLAEVIRRDVLAAATGATTMTLGTVSKALKQLEDELIIDRNQEIRLLQGDKLLDRLQQNYEPPKARRVRLKVDCAFEQLPQYVSMRLEKGTGPLVATGLSSVAHYATMQREEILSLYCPDAKRLATVLEGRETDRFPHLELVETAAQPLYFDARQEAELTWASPVQTYLELMRGDKRDRETADQVRAYILRRLKEDN